METFTSISTIEMRLLTALTEPMTSTEVLEALSIGYPYGIKVLRKMKQKKLISTQQRGNKTFYYTIRTSDTEEIFAAKSKLTGKTEYVIPFRGEWLTIQEALIKLNQLRQGKLELFNLVGTIIYNLRWNSYRKDNNLPTQRPYAEDMRRALEQRLALCRMELSFVEEVLKAPIWNDSAQVWKTITNATPDQDKGRANSDQLEKVIYK